MFFSIVIPVYNVEEYLEECVMSVINNGFKDYEIILVNDGSTDSSGKTCDKLKDEFNQISVIHKKNGGLSSARNKGLLTASGEYILFIDSDDYITTDSLDNIYNAILCQDYPDMVFLEAVKVYPDRKEILMNDGYNEDIVNSNDYNAILKSLSKLNKCPGSVCTKAFRKSFLTENNLMFEEGLTSEDIDFMAAVMYKAKSFAYLPQKYYYYRQKRDGSITNTSSVNSTLNLEYIISKWAVKKPSNDTERCINAWMAYEYVMILMTYADRKKHIDSETKKKIKRNKWIIMRGNNRVKVVGLVCGVLGLTLTSKLIGIAKKIMDSRRIK